MKALGVSRPHRAAAISHQPSAISHQLERRSVEERFAGR